MLLATAGIIASKKAIQVITSGINAFNQVNIWPIGGDTTAPTVTGFVIPATSASYTIPITTFTATDAVGVTGYLITESATPPLVGDVSWSGTAQTSYVVSSDATYTLYGWAKDAAGNISSSLNDSCVVTLVAPEVTGLFVDNTVVASATYDPATRSATGGTQTSYTTIQAAVDAMVSGDDVWLRGPIGGGVETYLENVALKGSTHPSGTIGNWCSLQSYPLERAKIDGRNIEQYAIGKNRNGRDENNDLAYWKFLRLEITGGMNEALGGSGLAVSGGPFIVRYNWIHDNLSSYVENGGGIAGDCWRDSIIEFNCVEDNGSLTSLDRNYAQIVIIGDYADDRIPTATNGFDGNAADAINKNVVRYNYLNGNAVGYKVKGDQLLTGRNPGVAPYDDTYSDWGDKIHHNILNGSNSYGIIAAQDFQQVYQNIFTNTTECLHGGHQPRPPLYKQCFYNNTFLDPLAKGIIRHSNDTDLYGLLFSEDERLFGYDYNNLIDQQPVDPYGAGASYFGTAINAVNHTSTLYPAPIDSTNYICSNNYTYRSDTVDICKLNNVFYTQAGFEAQIISGAPRVWYDKASSEGSDNLMVGPTGADALTTRGAHVVEGVTTILNGGILAGGNAHPYLVGVTIPTFVGATNPNDNAWVAGVLNNVSDPTWLAAQDAETDPTWVEA